jgi:hypothetical protein
MREVVDLADRYAVALDGVAKLRFFGDAAPKK